MRATLVLALLLASCQPAAKVPTTISGSGISNSAPFRLAGTYAVTWTAQADSDVGCFHGATLKQADGSASETLVNVLIKDRTPQSGATNLYNLADASYYVKASSGCRWSFTFTP